MTAIRAGRSACASERTRHGTTSAVAPAPAVSPPTPQAGATPLPGAKPKVYRSPVQSVTGSVLAIVLIVAGLILIGTVRQGGATSVVAGAGALIIGIAIELSVRSTYLSAARTGLTCSYSFRRQTARWMDIQDFEIVQARSQGLAAWTLTVRLPEGPMNIRSIAGSRHYVEKVVADLRALQQHYTQQPQADR